MNTAEEKRVSELTEEIDSLKKHLTEQSGYMSNREMHSELKQIGKLLTEKNDLTGLSEYAEYLYFDDGEFMREVKGFIGDSLGITDVEGTPLFVGDTVELQKESGTPYARLVMHGLPGEDIIREDRAVKTKGFDELDISDAFSAAFTISKCSCVEDYEQGLGRMEMQL